MKFSCFLLFLLVGGMNAKKKIFWVGRTFKNEKEYHKHLQERNLSELFIFPGTKWCGAGNISSNYDDLGEQAEADKCCREHDNCPDDFRAGETKYGLTNTAPHTRVRCDCDEKFHTCLKNVKTLTADVIGTIYFTMLNTKCFEWEYPIVSCNKRIYFPWIKCIEYNLDGSKEKVYQWFDLPNY